MPILYLPLQNKHEFTLILEIIIQNDSSPCDIIIVSKMYEKDDIISKSVAMSLLM